MRALRRFAKEVSFPVKVVVNNRRLGSTKNFAKAIGLATGEIIALADQDDLWHAPKLARLEAEFARSSEIGVVFSDARLVNERLRPLRGSLWRRVGFTSKEQRAMREGRALKVLLRHNVVTGATMAFRAEVRDLALPIPQEWVHDGWIAAVAALSQRLVPISEPLIDYRQHGGGQIGAGVSGLHALSRAATSRRSELESAVAQYRALALRAAGSQGEVVPAFVGDIKDKVAHLAARVNLPTGRAARLPGILRELRSGAYFRYSRGLRDLIKDTLRAEK